MGCEAREKVAITVTPAPSHDHGTSLELTQALRSGLGQSCETKSGTESLGSRLLSLPLADRGVASEA